MSIARICTWPEVFSNPELIPGRHHGVLCADGLTAWANCMCGNPPPASFGETLVMIGETIGMQKSATAENLSEFAYAQGWLKPEPEEKP